MVRQELKIKDTDEKSKKYRFDYSLIDPPLHKYGIYQCQSASEVIN